MISIESGQLVQQDPNDALVYALDWDTVLDDGVELADAGEIVITPVGDPGSPTLSYDSLELLEGNRSVRVRLLGGELGHKYRVAHRIATAESPEQIETQSFFMRIEHQ
jgi:hypothetical protein